MQILLWLWNKISKRHIWPWDKQKGTRESKAIRRGHKPEDHTDTTVYITAGFSAVEAEFGYHGHGLASLPEVGSVSWGRIGPGLQWPLLKPQVLQMREYWVLGSGFTLEGLEVA